LRVKIKNVILKDVKLIRNMLIKLIKSAFKKSSGKICF
jgi:hypothetical protein